MTDIYKNVFIYQEHSSSVVLSAVLMQPCFSSGLKDSFQADVFKVLAAILHFGNVVIKENGAEKSSIGVRNMFMCAVLGVFTLIFDIKPNNDFLGVSSDVHSSLSPVQRPSLGHIL